MKLIFKKTKQDIAIQIVKGTATVDFTYIELVKGLLIDNKFEESVFEGDITADEKKRLNEMIQKITKSVSEGQKIKK